jgi:hypothetical protein
LNRPDQRFFLPPLRLTFFPWLLLFEGFTVRLFALEDLVAFRPVDLFPVEEAFDFAALAGRFLTGRLPLLPPFVEAAGFFAEVFTPDFFAVAFTLAATALTAFLAGAAVDFLPAARPASAPMTPPTTAPTGPATLPKTAPVAAPAACFEIGGISMFSEDEPEVSVDDLFSSGMASRLLRVMGWLVSLHQLLRMAAPIQM